LNRWRLSKYNPDLRDERGAYTVDEWTAASDIGRDFAGAPLTVQDYLASETAHVEAIQSFMAELGLDALELADLCGPDGLTLEGALTPEVLASVAGVIREEQARLLADNALPVVDFDITAQDDPRRLSGEALEAALRLCLREVLWANLAAPGALEITFGYDYLLSVSAAAPCPEAQRRTHALGLFLEPSPAR